MIRSAVAVEILINFFFWAHVSPGDQFDIREFHHCILSCGAVPLGVLEGIVDQFIEDTRDTAITADQSMDPGCTQLS